MLPSTTAPTAARIASSVRAWLATLPERIPAHGDSAVRALCHMLIASWIADELAGGDRAKVASFAEVAEYVARSLNALEHCNHVHGLKPTLKLLVALLLSSEGLRVESFHRFLTQSVSVLRRADPVLEADPSLMDKRILLHSAGLVPRPRAASADGMRSLLDKFRLSASAEVVDELTLQLECLTGWGTQLVDAEQIPPSLGEILGGFAVHRFRNHEIIPAARLLRANQYIAASCVAARRDDLYEILCMHHQTHGPFGWYGPEAVELRKLSDVCAETELYLPTTLECLWTVAEGSLDGWRLFNKVPRYEFSET